MSESDPRAVVQLGLQKALAAIEAAEEELGRLDAAAGDGDHGAAMVRGLRAAVAVEGGDTAGQFLMQAGMAFSDAAGGASGALFGMLIMTIGQALPGDTIDAAAMHQALEKGLQAVQQLGKAQPGDKTMVDTLAPFVQAFGKAVADGVALAGAWQRALPAAEQGAAATAQMIAKKGRSAKLGERSLGHRDPGAVSMWYILQAINEALQTVC